MWAYKRPKPKPKASDHVPASVALLAEAKFSDLPAGGFSGEMLPAPDQGRSPAPAAPQPLQLEPPPWQSELESGDFDLAALAPPAPADTIGAIGAMRLDADGFDPPAPGPPMVTEPLRRFEVPEVDWRQEERERLARQAADTQHEPAKSLARRPAPPRTWRTS